IAGLSIECGRLAPLATRATLPYSRVNTWISRDVSRHATACSKYPSASCTRNARLLISQFAQGTLAVGPALAHLDIDVQENRLFQQLDHVLTCLGRDTFHVRPARAQQYGFVRFPLNDNAGGNPHPGFIFIPLLNDNGASIRELVADQS